MQRQMDWHQPVVKLLISSKASQTQYLSQTSSTIKISFVLNLLPRPFYLKRKRSMYMVYMVSQKELPVVFWDIELPTTFYWDTLYVCNNYARSQPIHLSTGELGWPDKICGNLWQSRPCPCYCHGSLGKPATMNTFSSVATHMEMRNISTNKSIWYNWLNWYYLLKWFKLEFSQFENHWMWIASCSCHIVDNLWKKLFSQILQVIWF